MKRACLSLIFLLLGAHLAAGQELPTSPGYPVYQPRPHSQPQRQQQRTTHTSTSSANRLDRYFSRFDANRDGRLSREERASALRDYMRTPKVRAQLRRNPQQRSKLRAQFNQVARRWERRKPRRRSSSMG